MADNELTEAAMEETFQKLLAADDRTARDALGLGRLFRCYDVGGNLKGHTILSDESVALLASDSKDGKLWGKTAAKGGVDALVEFREVLE